jgi:hypothetical protein
MDSFIVLLVLFEHSSIQVIDIWPLFSHLILLDLFSSWSKKLAQNRDDYFFQIVNQTIKEPVRMVATSQHWFNYRLLIQITCSNHMKNYLKSLIHQENVQWWLLLICQTLLNSQVNNVVLAKWCTGVLPIMSDLTWEQEINHRKLWSDIRPALFLVCLNATQKNCFSQFLLIG